MRNVSLPSANDVTTPQSVVAWDGRTGDATGVSITSEIPSHLPDQVTGVGGIMASTGSADWAFGTDVSDTSETPWTATTPEPGDPITIDLGRDDVLSRVFTGMVDDSGGSASGGVSSSGIIDRIHSLDRAVTIPPLARIMPPPTTDGSTTPRHIGLVGSYLVDRVLRDCGYYATPPLGARCVFSAPLTGSTWPERGGLVRSHRAGTWREQPYFSNAWNSPLGYRLYAEYEPQLDGYHAEGDLSRPMEIVLSAGNTQEDSCRIECVWGNGAAIAVGLTSGKSVTVQFTYPTDTSTRTMVFSATTAEIGSWRHISVRFEPNGDKTASITVRTNFGRSKRLGRASLPWWTEHTPMKKITVDLRGNVVGGLQVLFPASPSGLEAYTPTANITSQSTLASLNGSPAIVSRPAIELLKEWSEQECAAVWLDEDGVFQWRNRDAFVSGNVVWEGNSLDNLMDYEWFHSADGTRAAAIVHYQEVAQQRSNKSRLIVWQGSGQTMEPDDEIEEFISPPNDEAWISVDATPQVFTGTAGGFAFNNGRGSWVGYTAYDKDGKVHASSDNVGYNAITRALGPNTWKITQTWAGHVPAGVDHIKLTTPAETSALFSSWKDQNLPILRAQAKLMFGDAVQRATVSGAPKWAGDLNHDAGWWIQDESQARALAYWLAQQTAKPLPVVDEVRISPDARLQRGDKIRVTDHHRTGVSIVGVITKIQHRVSSGRHEMVLRLLVTQVTADRPTLGEYDAVFSGATLEARDAMWGASTLAQFDAEPLKR